MSGGGGSAPAPPDPVATAQAQGAINEQTARTQANLNRVDQYTPYGSLVYQQAGQQAAEAARDKRMQEEPGWDSTTEDAKGWMEAVRANAAGGPDRWQATTALSPEQQNLLDLSNQAQATYGRAANRQLGTAEAALSTPFQFGGPDVMYRPDFTGIGDPNQSRDAVEAALMSRINPQLERERSGLETRLVNQGLTPGSEAWRTSMLDYGQQANDARYGAIMNAGQEQSRMFGLGLGQAGFNNEAVQQSLQQQLALRAQPVNEAAALLTGQQIQLPQFQAVPQVGLQAPDYQGAVGQSYAGQMSAYNSAQQRQGANNGALAGAGSAIAGAAIIAF